MKASVRRWGLVAAVWPIVAMVCHADGKWLDGDHPMNWNVARATIPRAPIGDSDRLKRCGDARPATTAGDRALTAAGWKLVGSLQIFGSLSVAVATSDYDGMCRPSGYQVFAFVGDTFAGTLSPVAMMSRTDGAFESLRLISPTEMRASFVRYTDKDPACCASDSASMSYEISTTGPLVVPTGP